MAITPIFNVYLNAANPAVPLLVSPASNTAANGLQVVDGDKVTLRLYFVTATGASPTYDTPDESGSVVFAAKKNPSDAALVYFLDAWSWEDDYIEGTLDLATPEGFWTGSEPSKSIFCDIEVRTTANAERLTWSFFAQVKRQSYGGGETPPDPPEPYLDLSAALQVFVAYDRSQTLDSTEQTQAQTNIGGTTVGRAVFTAANAAAAATAVGLGTASDVTFGSVSADVFQAKESTGASIWTESGNYVATWGVSNSQNVEFFGEITATSFNARTSAGATLKNSAGATVVEWGVSNSLAATFGGDIEVNGDINAPGSIATVASLVSVEISAASGSFTVGATGDMTATHGKFQGSGGQAGHVQLKQGTAPNGTANETTLWGISGGIGWRDGTGTAYSLTLPTASSTLTTDERMMRMYRFAVGASAATISTSTSSWGSLITNGSSAVARLHSYFTVSTSASVASSRYTLWVESGATAVNPHALAGHPFYGLNYARGLEVSFPLLPAQFSGTTAVLPSDGYISGYFGQARNTHYEDIVQVGFGFLLKGDGTIQLQALATNGGSVFKSSFVASGIDMSVNASAIASLIRVTSDTAGNLALFVDGSLKCTLAGGPTGLTNVSTSNFTVFTFTVSNGASTPTKATAITIGLPLFIL